MLLLNSFASLVALSAAFPSVRPRSIGSYLESRQSEGASAYEAHTIEQPIDHFPHSKRYEPHQSATFKQRYFFDSSYYKPRGPVFLYIGGETSGESRFSNLQTGIIQILMEATNGLGVILENRYYGESYPFNTSTTDDLRVLTTEQTIADNAYFRQHATFPGVNATLNGLETPWIMYGGSLAGAQTAFTMKTYNSLFAGGIGSSATTYATLEYPEWYDPIIRFGPADCISRIVDIVDKMDQIIESGNKEAIEELKTVFGLAALQNIGDFAQTISYPIGGPMFYPTNTWQELNWAPGHGSEDFYHFCSNVTNPSPSASTAEVDNLLSKYTHGEPWTGLGGYVSYVKTTLLPLCESGEYASTKDGCFGLSQNGSHWSDTQNSADRSYLYTSCTEVGAFIGAPKQGPSLISRVLHAPYTQQWCTWAFPPGVHNRIPPTPNLNETNKYGGYNVQAPKLALIDGGVDVWVDLCYHSHLAGRARVSSDLHPSYLIAGGGHHWDSTGIKNITAEPGYIREAHLWEIRTVRRWVAEWESKSAC